MKRFLTILAWCLVIAVIGWLVFAFIRGYRGDGTENVPIIPTPSFKPAPSALNANPFTVEDARKLEEECYAREKAGLGWCK